MARRPTRRRFLAAATAAVGLAGCTGRSEPSDPQTVTPAPVPTDAPTPTRPSPTPGPAPDPRDIRFEVTVVDGFDDSTPSRLDIVFHNIGARTLTALGGVPHVVPFAPDDHVATDESGARGLLLVPDGAKLTVDSRDGTPVPIEASLPRTPDDGCWSLSLDRAAVLRSRGPGLHAVSVRPGWSRRRQYRLYFIDECRSGRYTFVNTFDLAVGDPPHERSLHRARLVFEVVVSESMVVTVRPQEPVVDRHDNAG